MAGCGYGHRHACRRSGLRSGLHGTSFLCFRGRFSLSSEHDPSLSHLSESHHRRRGPSGLPWACGNRRRGSPTPRLRILQGPETTAWRLVVTAGAWIVRTPAALFVIMAGVLIDSVSRLFLTFSSSYFRIIELPEATFGLIGAAMGGLGLIVSPIARRMVAGNSITRNYGLLGMAVLAGLIGVAFRWTHWGRHFPAAADRGDDGTGFHGLLLLERPR